MPCGTQIHDCKTTVSEPEPPVGRNPDPSVIWPPVMELLNAERKKFRIRACF